MIVVRLPELCVRFDDDYKRDEIGRFAAGGASPIGKNDYARYSHSTDPMSEWGHAMFAEGDASSGYGPEKFTINEDANLVHINDLKQQIEDAAEKHDLPNGYDSVKDLISAANPSNIVDSAQLWDDPDGFQWMWEHVLEPNGISGITTRDGAIVFDPKMISHSRLDYSEDQPRDKKGRFSSDPTHVRLSVAEKAHLVSTSRAGGEVGKRATEALAMHKKGFHGEARKHLAEIKKTHPVLEVQARGPVPVPALQEHAKVKDSDIGAPTEAAGKAEKHASVTRIQKAIHGGASSVEVSDAIAKAQSKKGVSDNEHAALAGLHKYAEDYRAMSIDARAAVAKAQATPKLTGGFHGDIAAKQFADENRIMRARMGEQVSAPTEAPAKVKEAGETPAARPGEEGLSAEEVARRAAVRAAYKDKAAKEKADKLAAVEKAAVAAEKKEAKQQARAAEKAASPSLFGRPRGHTHIVSGDTKPLAEAFKKHGFTWDPVSSTWSGDQESVNKLNRFYNTSGVTSEHINDYMSKRVAENKERAAAPKPAPAPKAAPKPAPATSAAPAPKTWFNPKKSYESGSEEAEDASFHGGSYYHGSPGRR